jgi:hypothetical protein
MKLHLKPDNQHRPPHQNAPVPVSEIEFTLDEWGTTSIKCQATDSDGRQFELTLYPGEIDRIEEDAK